MEKSDRLPLIIVRGGGDIATGTIHRLVSCGLPVLVLEAKRPSAIRRQVAFSEAVYEKEIIIEGKKAVLINQPEEWQAVSEKGDIPVLTDETGEAITLLKPDIVIDAILAKKNLGTDKDMAPLTIALGPGFTAGEDVDVVIETMRGHNLGRIIRDGSAMPNTGIPGVIAGVGKERVIHAPCEGTICVIHGIGEIVRKEETIAMIGDVEVKASVSGIIRGMIRDQYPVTKGFKIADIDPRIEEMNNCYTISDKARCIAGSVLEVVCEYIFTKGVVYEIDENRGCGRTSIMP